MAASLCHSLVRHTIGKLCFEAEIEKDYLFAAVAVPHPFASQLAHQHRPLSCFRPTAISHSILHKQKLKAVKFKTLLVGDQAAAAHKYTKTYKVCRAATAGLQTLIEFVANDGNAIRLPITQKSRRQTL